MQGVQVQLLVLGVLCWPSLCCPPPCTCTQKEQGKRVRCQGDTYKISNLTSILLGLPDDTSWLDLTGNEITIIHRGDFAKLQQLQRLDLDSNLISTVEPGAFLGLQQLQELSMNRNKISQINSSMFEGLPSLKKLFLSGNQLQTIQNGTFNNLTNLKRVEFQSDLLLCDCRLHWIVKWLKSSDVKIKLTKCAVPVELKDRAISKLSEDDLHCGWDLVLPLFELKPYMSQIVFEGDKMPFQCHVSLIEPSTEIYWLHKAVPLSNNREAGTMINTRRSADGTLVSDLVIDALKFEDNGVWQCMVVTPRGNETRSVTITVISEQTLFCPPVTTKTNKGTFVWPRSMSGLVSELACTPSSKYQDRGLAKAVHECDEQGHWHNLNTDQCQYESEVTRGLEQLAESGNVSWVLDRPEHLTQYMNRFRSSIKDKMDIIYMSRIIQRIGKNVHSNNQLGEVIMQLVSMLMDVDVGLLRQAQEHDRACTRMVNVVESLPQQMLDESLKLLSSHSKNIALEALEIHADTFTGLMCIAQFPQSPAGFSDNSFFCSAVGNASAMNVQLQEDWFAIIHTPANILQMATCENNATCSDTYQIQYIVYKDAALFPVLGLPRPGKPLDSITTPVISCSIVNFNAYNLTVPVTISLRTQRDGIHRRPVFWDANAQGGYGQWKTEGCTVVKETKDVMTFQCDHLTNFAVLQSWEAVVVLGHEWYWRLLGLHPPIYAGSCVLLLCCMAVLITYIAVPGELKMSNKAKHSIGNLAVSMFLLCLVFTFGIKMTQIQLACQIVGIVLHYLSICTLFWILITAYNMYRSFTRQERQRSAPVEALDSPIPPKPMLRFYLIGWGIALIVVGITAAVNLHHYSGNKPYCFLSFEPSIGAFLVPVAILTTLNVIFLLCICCVIHSASPLPLDEPETEEINELELANNEIESIPRDDLSTSSSEDSALDLEFRPVSQLRALAAALLLYLATWTCAAFSVARPLHHLVPYHDLIFNYAYAFCAAVLGIFFYCFYCIARHDARHAWSKVSCCYRRKSVYAMNTNNTLVNHINGEMLHSTSSVTSEYTSRSTNASYSNPLRYYSAQHQSNTNIVPSQSMTDPSVISSGTEAMPSFYNPRQNGAAKKYWGRKNQQKHLSMLHKDRASDVSFSGGESCSERNSAYNRQGYGDNRSDTNSHISSQMQKIQIHTRHHKSCHPKATHNKFDGPYTIEAAQPLLPMSDFNMTTSTPVGCMTALPCGHADNCYGSKNHVNKDAVPLVSLSPVGYGISPLLPAEVTCIPPPKDILCNRGDLTGRNEKRSSLNSDLQNMEMYRPPDPPVSSRGRQLSGESDGLSAVHTHRSHDSKEGEARSHHSSDSGTGSHKRKKRESFIDQLEQRIPHNKSPGLVCSNPGSHEPTLTHGAQSPWCQDSDLASMPGLGQPDSTLQSGEESHVTSNQSSDDTHTSDSHKPPTNPHPPTIPVADPTDHPPDCAISNNIYSDDRKQQNGPMNGPLTHSSLGKHSDCNSNRQEDKQCGKDTGLSDRVRCKSEVKDTDTGSQQSSANASQDCQSSWDSRQSRHPKNWEDEFKDRPPKPAYSFVNHQYHDKVIHKLIQQSANGLIDPIARGFAWFPRSISAYEQVANDAMENNSDYSDDSSSDVSLADIWVLQKPKSKNKIKKETSV